MQVLLVSKSCFFVRLVADDVACGDGEPNGHRPDVAEENRYRHNIVLDRHADKRKYTDNVQGKDSNAYN